MVKRTICYQLFLVPCHSSPNRLLRLYIPPWLCNESRLFVSYLKKPKELGSIHTYWCRTRKRKDYLRNRSSIIQCAQNIEICGTVIQNVIQFHSLYCEHGLKAIHTNRIRKRMRKPRQLFSVVWHHWVESHNYKIKLGSSFLSNIAFAFVSISL